jgi:hypothetical protein
MQKHPDFSFNPVQFQRNFFSSSWSSPVSCLLAGSTVTSCVCVAGVFPVHAHPLHPVQLGRALRPLLPPGVRQVLRAYAHTARAFLRCAGVRPLARLHQPARHAHRGRMHQQQRRHRRIGPPIFARRRRANSAESPFLHCAARHSVGRWRRESVRCGLGAHLANGGPAPSGRGGGGGRTTVVRCWGWAHLPAGVHQPGTHHNFCTVGISVTLFVCELYSS